MKKETVVISLGGSLIAPDKIDIKFLKKFKEIIYRKRSKYKFIIVCGGGTVARKYISALAELKLSEKFQDFAGISATRMNARFMNYIFNSNPGVGIPHTIKDIENSINNQGIIFCGALEYKPHETSDSTAAEIANHFKTNFINLTNVSGLHDKNPLQHKDAKLIPKISWEGLYKMAKEKEFKPGQHFVIDQTASRIIMQNKITTYILGKDLKQFNNLLNKEKFIGTTVQG
ncbi:MAG: UMP kinase [Candidatus Nanoarchaeia archaeon]